MDFKEAAKAIAAQISRAISFGQDPEPIVARHLEKFYQIGIEDGKKSSDESWTTKALPVLRMQEADGPR